MNLSPFSFEPQTSQPAGSSDSPASGSPRPKRRGRPPSIGIRLGQDGKADTSAMTPDQLARIRSAVSGTSILTADERKALEAQKQAKIDSVKPFCVPLLKLLGGIEAAIIQKSRKLTNEQAQIFHYTDAEVSLLQEPTAAVIAKHASGLEKYSEELTLVTYMVQIFHQKTMALNDLLARQARSRSESVEQRHTGQTIRDLESDILVKTNGSAESVKS